MVERLVPDRRSPATPSAGALLVLARGAEVVVREDGSATRFPTLREAEKLADGVHYLGAIAGEGVYAAPLARGASLPEGDRLVSARSLASTFDMAGIEIAGRAIAISEWDVMHRFCGRCATPTSIANDERCRVCPACAGRFYPRVSPAVIVLIQREDEILLARNATFPLPFFSCLAGFVEPGESLEETVAREVREEVSVEVDELRYFGSQPWPFGSSFMIGFRARWAGAEIEVDGHEIAEARWFRASEMPLLPPSLSIARQMIDAWLAEQRVG